MLTMLLGGPKDGEFFEVPDSTPHIVIPVLEPINFQPVKLAETALPISRHIIYRRVMLRWLDPFNERNIDWRWRDDIFVHPDLTESDVRMMPESVRVNITMRLWRERWRRKVIAETPEYILRIWREDGVRC